MTKPTMLTASLGYSEAVATIEEMESKKEEYVSDGQILTENLDLESRVILALSHAETDCNMAIMAGNFIKALREEGVVISVKKP
ncbi:MAG: hypothetical protein IPP74_13275 [Alphaproteobacteria bacterium]|nr:hypothetical protein [Alphaproteobacteria bacterium]